MFWLSLVISSFWYRRGTQWLTLVALVATLGLWLAVDHVKNASREHFTHSVSGTDLIVGARGGSLNLLLYSVFRVGNPTSDIRWSSVERIIEHPNVKWWVPIQLGDSYRGYRVLGTNINYFTHFRVGKQQALELAQGRAFVEDSDEVVLGAEVARRLGHQLGDRLIITHGLVDTRLADHNESPLQVVGILAATGTPVDQSVHVSMAALDRMHQNWQTGTYVEGSDVLGRFEPRQITALMLGLESRLRVFQMQRSINQMGPEPLMAILPGATLAELWQMMAIAEQALTLIAHLVLALGLLAVLAQLLTSLEARRTELWLWRSLGLRPWQMMALLVAESLALTLVATVLAVLILLGLSWGLSGWVLQEFSVHLPLYWPTRWQAQGLLFVIGLAAILTLVPAWRAYRMSGSNANP